MVFHYRRPIFHAPTGRKEASENGRYRRNGRLLIGTRVQGRCHGTVAVEALSL